MGSSDASECQTVSVVQVGAGGRRRDVVVVRVPEDDHDGRHTILLHVVVRRLDVHVLKRVAAIVVQLVARPAFDMQKPAVGRLLGHPSRHRTP